MDTVTICVPFEAGWWLSLTTEHMIQNSREEGRLGSYLLFHVLVQHTLLEPGGVLEKIHI